MTNATKVVVAYNHDGADLSPVYLAVVPRGQRLVEEDWRPALRDTVGGKRVVWARFPIAVGIVYLRTKDGTRAVPRIM